MTVHAAVLSRRVDPANGVAGWGSSRYDCRVVFDVGSSRPDLYVTENDCARLEESPTVQLTWQHENLIDFVPDKA